MPINLDTKKQVVAEVSSQLSNTLCAVVAKYDGLTVGDMTSFRCQARAKGVYVRVVRNSLARRAIVGTDFACLDEALTGPLVLMLSQEEPGAAARILRDFSKKNDALQVHAMALDGQLFGPEQLATIASLPNKEESIAQFMAVSKAPVVKFVRTLAEPVSQLVRVLAAIADSKKAA